MSKIHLITKQNKKRKEKYPYNAALYVSVTKEKLYN